MQLHEQTNREDNIQGAEIRLPTSDLSADLAFFMKTLGFRMDKIYPADYPSVSVLSGHGAHHPAGAGCVRTAGHNTNPVSRSGGPGRRRDRTHRA